MTREKSWWRSRTHLLLMMHWESAECMRHRKPIWKHSKKRAVIHCRWDRKKAKYLYSFSHTYTALHKHTNTTDTTNTYTTSTERLHRSNTHCHNRPHTVNLSDNAQRPDAHQQLSEEPPGKGRGGPNQGSRRGRIDPGPELNPGSEAAVSQTNTNTTNKDKRRKTHSRQTSESNGQFGQDLTIVFWNIQGFHCNKNLLIAPIEHKQPDIILLQETLTH